MIRVHLGFEVGTGEPVVLNCAHMAVVGQTQESGKTTTLEALVQRSCTTALTFLTKRGERSFESGRRIQPYFRDRADWQFVNALLEATLAEKNKYLRPAIMNLCRSTKTLADVLAGAQTALKKARGYNEGIFTQLVAYLELIVPEIQRANLAPSLDLQPGLNVMDIADFPLSMQMLFIQSALDQINDHCRDTVVVIPEAWEFVPEGKGSPVKASAVKTIRKGAGIGNYIWLDSQDLAGVDKTILRQCTTLLFGVQREANELKRNIANIPAGLKRPTPADIALLGLGEFFACFKTTTARTYVQPAWMDDETAQMIARGQLQLSQVADQLERWRARLPAPAPTHAEWAAPAPIIPPQPVPPPPPKESAVDAQEAAQLRAENLRLKDQVENLTRRIDELTGAKPAPPAAAPQVRSPVSPDPARSSEWPGVEALYQDFRQRLLTESPGLIQLMTERPEILVNVTRKTITMDESSLSGRIARLLANGFYNAGATNSGTRTELRRTGPDTNNAAISKVLNSLRDSGFLTISGDNYVAVPGMKVNIKES